MPPDTRIGAYELLEVVGAGVFPIDGDRKLRPIVQTAFVESDGQFSPDGQWIAYQSNESGQFEIYVQKYPTGGRERISPNGGAQVRWRADGRELFYLALDGRLMSVPVRVDSRTSTIQPAVPVPLFTTRIGPALLPVARQQYSVSPDGQRFLMNVITGEDKTMPITVVLNSKDLQN
jgi:WD40 repeat protein